MGEMRLFLAMILLFPVLSWANANAHPLPGGRGSESSLSVVADDQLTAPQTAQYERLIHELRCLVCQNQSLADSSADLAADLRDKVHQQVLTNKTDDEILTYFVARYGEFVRYRPSLSLVNLMLWLGPVLFVIGGVLIARKSFSFGDRSH